MRSSNTGKAHSSEEIIRRMGFGWGEHEYCASDYFPQLFELAITLVGAHV